MTPRVGEFLARHPWFALLLRKLGGLAAVIFVLVFASFMISRLIPGDPAVALAGQDASAEQVAVIRHELGIDRPMGVQFLSYLRNLAHGDMGQSFQFHEPVTQVIGERVDATMQLAIAAILLVLLLSVPAGMLAAVLTRGSRHHFRETAFGGITGLIGSLPEYVAATFLAFIFGVWLQWLPVAGATGLDSLILPAFSVALRPIALLARIVRVETLNVMEEDYIRTVRGKRLPARILYPRHVLPNVITAALTIGGLLFAQLIGGTVIVENVFARVGLGTEIVGAILTRDYPVVQAAILVLGVAVVVVNAAVGITVAMLDPRSLARQV